MRQRVRVREIEQPGVYDGVLPRRHNIPVVVLQPISIFRYGRRLPAPGDGVRGLLVFPPVAEAGTFRGGALSVPIRAWAAVPDPPRADATPRVRTSNAAAGSMPAAMSRWTSPLRATS